jgi:hypothetical protein
MYRKAKEACGMTQQQIKPMWKSLPHESKKYWEMRGRGGAPKLRKMPSEMSELRKMMKGGALGRIGQISWLMWMENSMAVLSGL